MCVCASVRESVSVLRVGPRSLMFLYVVLFVLSSCACVRTRECPDVGPILLSGLPGNSRFFWRRRRRESTGEEKEAKRRRAPESAVIYLLPDTENVVKWLCSNLSEERGERSRGVFSACLAAGKVGWSRGGPFRKGAKGSLGNISSPAGPAADDCHRCDEAPEASAVRARRLRLGERAR